jgi:hypothetical protein
MLKHLSPKQKRLAAIAGVGGIALILMMLARRGSPAPAVDPATQPTGSLPGATPPANFSADNSSYLADLGNQIAGLSSGLDALSTGTATALGDQAAHQQAADASILAAFGKLQDQWANTPASNGNPGPESTGQPAGSSPPAGPAAATPVAAAPQPPKSNKPSNVFLQDSGERKGLYYAVEQKHGHSYRYYESAPGRADYQNDKKPVLIK